MQLSVDQILGNAIAWIGGVILDAVVFAIAFVAVFVVGKYLLVPAVVRVIESRNLGSAIRSLGESITNALVWVLALAVGFTVTGFGTFLAAFATLGGAVALAIGFAAQDLLGNFVAGVFILKDRPFQPGDWIEWDDNVGRVEDIDLRVSRVRTFDNELITVPNSDLANNAVTNPVAYDTLRQKFTFGVGYDADIDETTDIIIEAAEDHGDILEDPAPSVRVTGLGDSAIELQSRIWIDEPDRSDFMRVRSEHVQDVKERLDAAGIEIPYVYRELTGEVEVLERVAEE